MKRLILCMLAMIAFAGCSKDDGVKIPDGGFKVGDMYVSKSKQGIVVRVNPDLKSGLIISSEDTFCNWDDARAWTGTLGREWRMPTVGELRDLYNVKAAVNDVLLEYGMSVIDGKNYWTDSDDGDSAWWVSMSNGSSSLDDKEYHRYARAVSEF